MSQSALVPNLRTLVGAATRPCRVLMVASALLNIVTALLDAISVGAIVPFVALLSMPDLFMRFPTLAVWVPQSLQESRSTLVVVGVFVFGLIYLLRAVSNLSAAVVQARLHGMLVRDVCRVLYQSYVHRSYAFHLEKGPAFFTTRLSPSVHMAVCTVLGLLQFGAEALTTAFIVLVVVLANPTAALVSVLVMGLPAAVIYLFIRGKSEHLGSEIQDVSEQNTKVMLAGIGGIKELKVLGRESHFLDEYWTVQNRWRDLYTRFILYKTVPRILIELGGVIAVLVVCAVFAAKGDIDHLIPILGLYAAAAFRLLPSIHQLLLALTVIHHNMSGLTAIVEDLRDAGSVGQSHPAAGSGAHTTASKEPLQTIEIQDLGFRFAEELPLVIDGLDLTIRAGETVGIVGRSGTGKSTLVDIVLGLLEPSRGRILINERDIAHDLREWQHRVGYVPQTIYLVDDTIRRNVCLGMPDEDIDEERVWQALSAAQLRDFVASLPEGLDTIVGERGVKLSGGQRQRIGIARALYGRPEVLVLDEATSALDSVTEAEFMRAIDGLHGQMTILLVAHRLTTLQNSDRIFVIDSGRVQVSSYDMLMGKASRVPASMA